MTTTTRAGFHRRDSFPALPGLPAFPADIPCRTDLRDWTEVHTADAEPLIRLCWGCQALIECEQVRQSIPARDRRGMVFAGHFTPGGPR